MKAETKSPQGVDESIVSTHNRQETNEQLSQPVVTAHEYAESIRMWLLQQHWSMQMSWYMNTMMPFMAMNCAALNASVAYQNFAVNSIPVSAPVNEVPTVSPASSPATSQTQFRGAEYSIPPVWRRVVAEFIDFLLLFTMKLGVSLLALDYVGMVDMERYDLETLLNAWDSSAAMAITAELIAMEFINRIVVCIFETMCLWRGLRGATPGKRLMHLQVIACSEVLQVTGDRFLVIPAGNLGFWSALLRSLLKNFSMAFLFPLCFTVVLSPHKRASYDMLAGSIVVEDEFIPRPLVM